MLIKTKHIKAAREFMIRLFFVTGLFALLFLLSFYMSGRLFMVRYSDNNVSSGSFISWKNDHETLLKSSGLNLKDGDVCYWTEHDDHEISLNIRHAFEISVYADNGEESTALCSGTVEEILQACNIKLGPHDYTEPSLHTLVGADDAIAVHRVQYRDSIEEEPIPYETEYVYTSLYYKHPYKQVILQNGEDGIRQITNRERVVDGAVESSRVIKIEDTLEPKSLIIKAYQAGAPVSSVSGPEVINGVPSSYSAVYTGRATGYYSARGRGSSHLGLHYGTVAVNPAIFPYGTKLYITSTDGRLVYGYAIATDTGGALLNGSALVDLFYETYDESLMNGVQQVRVYVIG